MNCSYYLSYRVLHDFYDIDGDVRDAFLICANVYILVFIFATGEFLFYCFADILEMNSEMSQVNFIIPERGCQADFTIYAVSAMSQGDYSNITLSVPLFLAHIALLGRCHFGIPYCHKF